MSVVGVVGGVISVAAVPVPLSVTLCGLVVALLVIVTVPVAAPVTVGANCTVMAQLFVGVTVVQAFDAIENAAPDTFT